MDSGLGSGMESEVFGSVVLSMTLSPFLIGPVPPVDSFLNFLHVFGLVFLSMTPLPLLICPVPPVDSFLNFLHD